MPETSSFKAVKELYFLLDRGFNRLFGACATDAERDELRRNYVNARDNFWESQNRVFAENDPLVKQLSGELKEATAEIEAMLHELQAIAATLLAINSAVRLGSSLITLGSGA